MFIQYYVNVVHYCMFVQYCSCSTFLFMQYSTVCFIQYRSCRTLLCILCCFVYAVHHCMLKVSVNELVLVEKLNPDDLSSVKTTCHFKLLYFASFLCRKNVMSLVLLLLVIYVLFIFVYC